MGVWRSKLAFFVENGSTNPEVPVRVSQTCSSTILVNSGFLLQASHKKGNMVHHLTLFLHEMN